MTDLIKFEIDGLELEAPRGTTVLQAAKAAGIEIPHFCYHDKLSIAGNCRMCLVEVEDARGKAPKPAASCHMTVYDGLKVFTQSETTRKAQKGTMEMLLINHPLDCPICDQGGECDLQDIAVSYGSDRTHYHEMKRAVDDIEIGSKIKTVMTRCIHCTRCIRFATEIAGVEEMGATGRGENMQVGTYVSKALASELAGNMIDICPVGALTNKPYAFEARPWELVRTPSIDISDSLGSNIEVHHRAGEVMRIVPRTNDAVNECWIADTARFCWDGLTNNRLDTPMVRTGAGKLQRTGWPQAFDAFKKLLSRKSPEDIAVLVGDEFSAETLYAAKQLFDALEIPAKNINAATNWHGFAPTARNHYTLNMPLAEMEKADAVLLVGCDPRHEAPLLNLRLRKAQAKGAKVYNIGAAVDLRFPVMELGNDAGAISEAKKCLKGATKPLILFGNAAQMRSDANVLYVELNKLGEVSVLPNGAGRVAALDIFGAPKQTAAKLVEKAKLVILLGDVILAPEALTDKKVIYMGTHQTIFAKQAALCMPSTPYTEQDGWFVNAEGRVQASEAAVKPMLNAKEGWKIFRALSSELCKAPLPFDSLQELRAQLVEALPIYAELNAIPEIKKVAFKAPASAKMLKQPFAVAAPDFYQSNAIMRASQNMANIRAEWLAVQQEDAA